MVMKSSFLGSWKHRRWKSMSGFYRTVPDGRRQGPHCSRYKGIKSMNMTITWHVKNGQLEQARRVFDEMPERTVVSWNAMISGYSKWGKFNEALSLLSLMYCSNSKLNETTCSSALSICGRERSLGEEGQQIHGLVLKSGLESFQFVGSSLLYFYASCCDIRKARQVFDELHETNELLWSLMLVGCVQNNLLDDALCVFNKMPRRGVVEWTTLISGYVKIDGGCKKALELFQRMRTEAVPNEFTLDSIIRACGRLGALPEGKVVHGLLIKLGFELELSISGALVDFYSNSEAIGDAKKIYDTLENPCMNISNTLIGGLLRMGKVEEAELVFSGLVERNSVSYSLMIKGYALFGRVEDSKKLFLETPARSLICLNTMIHVLCKAGEIHKALELFEETKEKGSPVTWNSMISGYIENDQHENAINLYIDMRRLSISPTRSTFSALLRACSCLGALQKGQQIHSQLTKTPFELNIYVGTALVDMYSKCGSISDAQASFICISNPNVAAWTALICGYAHHGLGSEATLLFEQMLDQGINPNAATLVAVLSACTAAGLVNKGMEIFRSMEQAYGLAPSLEHLTCAVALLCQSGLLLEAEELMKEMPFEADEILLITMLNACWSWIDIDVGERVAHKMFTLDPKPTCVLMSNMYAALGKWGEKIKARKILKELEVKKDPGCSWIDINSRTNIFSVEDRTHPCCNMIYATLKHLKANIESCAEFQFYSPEQMKAALFSFTP
ncbi:pentatricopeptide repeat-containing protein At1g28690, mitochondrial-like [Coffea eugenioides]|uniref:Pentatricopeptide repeat-containing protein At3g25970 n=1 Tax=Coffea arabica TaxID=13443 RepID=A0A6P6T777_COFAR|nr:pentatricopeptide repeat-containing protein At1g28690, mitochondrial-like [Coffea arabica]XP_027179676.1 pentatricopeptide repeat-containing protein At1g28690, mitochondrial-like [Coffea eugenioides]